jgi:hypothetical protein
LWVAASAFLGGLVVLHGIIIAFHLLMCSNTSAGLALQNVYYSTQAGGKKEWWPLFEWYLPELGLAILLFFFLARQWLIVLVIGWLVGTLSLVGTSPIYATRLTPKPIMEWGSARPPPFAPITREGSNGRPELLLILVAIIIARFSVIEEAKNEEKKGSPSA